ncbi:MAG: sulfate transporter CysZ [Gammaproteobacteria bacterium]|nr:sulfate transporter CysZ [Gammaproteobacteria bacterium]
MLSEMFSGAGYLLQGFREITRPGIRRFALLPVLINVAVFALIIILASRFYGGWLAWLLPQGDAWWVLATKTMLWALFGLTVMIAVFFGFTVVANLIGAAFNGFLAEAVERRASDNADSTGTAGITRVLREIPRALVNELRKIGYYCLWAIPLALLFIVPIVQLAAPFAWALFAAWMLALEYGDYPMSNHGIAFAEVRRRMRQEAMTSTGFGAAILVAMLIPVLNLVVMPAAVAGATLMWVERLKIVDQGPATKSATSSAQ